MEIDCDLVEELYIFEGLSMSHSVYIRCVRFFIFGVCARRAAFAKSSQLKMSARISNSRHIIGNCG